MLVVAAAQTGRIQSCKPKPSVAIGTQSNPLCASAGGNGGSGPREHDDLERWYGGRALPWHRADLGFFGAHALSRRARVARMDSCGPFLATHFLLEKQVEARAVADVMIDKKTKKMMLRIAEDYETLRG